MTREQRETVERALAASSEAVAGLFARRSPEELTRRPREGSWSAAECVVHLSLTSAATVPRVEAAVGELRERGLRTLGRSRMDLTGWMLRWALEPGRLRSRTKAPFEPPRVEPLVEVPAEFARWQARLVATLREAEGLALSARKIVSPFDPRVRYDVYSAFRILETHERRHLRQAEEALRAGGREGP